MFSKAWAGAMGKSQAQAVLPGGFSLPSNMPWLSFA